MLQIYGNRKKKTCWDIWPPWGARKALREKEISQVIGVKISFKIKMCWKGCKNFEWQNIPKSPNRSLFCVSPRSEPFGRKALPSEKTWKNASFAVKRVASDVIFPKVTCDSDANIKCYLKIGWYANIGIGYSSNMIICLCVCCSSKLRRNPHHDSCSTNRSMLAEHRELFIKMLVFHLSRIWATSWTQFRPGEDVLWRLFLMQKQMAGKTMVKPWVIRLKTMVKMVEKSSLGNHWCHVPNHTFGASGGPALHMLNLRIHWLIGSCSLWKWQKFGAWQLPNLQTRPKWLESPVAMVGPRDCKLSTCIKTICSASW